MTEGPRFYGKYRGAVLNNIDPEKRGRLLVQVADVTGLIPANWAQPCVPLAGLQTGWFAMPPVGAWVWVEFEGGDPSHPIWVGCCWESAAEVPPLAQLGLPGLGHVVLQTTGQHVLMISDVPGPTGGILLKSPTGALIMVNDTGITITNGKGATIVMAGPSVTVNGGALVVT
jgi:uncharacterized protein involved in type VI secretion and phage assembly